MDFLKKLLENSVVAKKDAENYLRQAHGKPPIEEDVVTPQESEDAKFVASLLPNKSEQPTLDQELAPLQMPKSQEPVRKLAASKVPNNKQDITPVQSLMNTMNAPSSDEAYSEELNDAAMKKAMADRNEASLTAALGKSAALIGAGIAGKNGPIQINNDVYGDIEKMGQHGMQDIATRREMMDKDLTRKAKLDDLKDENALRDPKSEISKALRDGANLFGIKVSENTTGKQLRDSGVNLGSLLVAKESAEARKMQAAMLADSRKSQQEERKQRTDANLALQYQKMASGHPAYKVGQDVLNELGTVKGILDDAYLKGGQSMAALGTKIAKAMGERGVLTEEDVTRYVKNPVVVQAILSKGKAAATGKITKADYDNLTRLVNLMEDKANKNVNKAYNETATKLSRNTKMPLEEAKLLINPSLLNEERKPDSSDKVTVTNGKETFEIDASDLEHAMKDGYRKL